VKRNTVLTWLGLGAACAACCAPLLLPLFAGAGAAGARLFAGGRLLGLPLDVLVCGAILVAIAVGIGLWWMQRRRAAKAAACACETSCVVETCGPVAPTKS